MSEEYGLIHNHMLGEEETETQQSKYQDYVGFIFNGFHSKKDLGIVRTSNGSRFDENLLPTIQDKTVQVPGGNGTYFFGSYYTQRQFTVPFAFDDLDEQGIVKLKKVLGDKKIHDLIFDEAPYKVYKAKITGSATIKHIPFSEGPTNRRYKGEGSIQFTCYQPFARSRFKFLKEVNKKDSEGNEVFDHYEIPDDELTKEYGNYSNIEEWKDASGIQPASDYNQYDKVVNNIISLYNPGHVPSHFRMKLTPNNEGKIPEGSLNLSLSTNSLVWKEMELKGSDAYVVINTKLNLIEGYKEDNTKSGKIYNEYITDGTFFKIPIDMIEGTNTIKVTGVEADTVIEYDYYYL